ncbi:M48 family metalloprotease [Lysobacter sp. KIS68-7]|uniref:M48 family metalloprotease n=1 Tax=Lysobacter sp. KIS68-7 TaxID=2904252 RepID=UPI001E4B12B9|nr:M48 family metalloprotease [Lysobacter sp. KIS68-7]UHQ19447.1 M48 family metalloprotease [Lysobacter sp. KIS68-7]
MRVHRILLTGAVACACTVAIAAGQTPATVHKPDVEVHAAPDFQSPTVTKLAQNAKVDVTGQKGLWFEVATPDGKKGYVRVNDVRMEYATKAGGNANALFTGQAGKGRVSETAGVRGIDESDLQGAGYDAAQFAQLEANRVSPESASADANAKGHHAKQVALAGEFKPVADAKPKATQAEKKGGFALARGLMSAVGLGAPAPAESAMDVAEASQGKSEAEQSAEEAALGPEIAGRVLGAAHLWDNAEAQARVNRVGRWMASQTSRPELPWSFGVIDTPEINAFAAPGGYILITRGMYELLGEDDEVAAVIGHELSHVVQRDHYNVIQKQEQQSAIQSAASSNVSVGGGIAGSMAKAYVEKHGATIMLTSLDRDAEYRADQAAEVYLARSGYDPLALYAVLQKMTALGSQSGNLAALYKTHPPLKDRLDRLDRSGVAGAGR